MSLHDKYADLINAANAHGVANLAVRDADGVLYIDGEAPSAEVKQQLWDLYGQLDPDYRAADVVMNLSVAAGAAPEITEYTIVPGDSLSKIGAKLGKNWKEIWDLNRDKIGDKPDYIQAGWVIKIPA
ncbi:MAG: LysM peptidoglycan-binding domain-containing protein [Chitinophagaceae bacterium]|jgi:nucleoid-associated protein YgaU|nr:LysM peptidoglycan-binding domain-containing protein [Chitinophagaceae bacterium]